MSNTPLRPRTDLGTEWIGDELLILDKANDKIHQLNPVASAIWEGLADGRDLESIARSLADSFDTSIETTAPDVQKALNQFENMCLLQRP